MTAPETARLISEIVARWKVLGIARAGTRRANLDAVEQRYRVRLPDEFAALFLAADGMTEEAVDDLMIRFWPIAELRPASDEVAKEDAFAYGGFFIFADYSLWAHGYAIKLDDSANAGTIAIVGGPRPVAVASSFSSFLEIYVRHPDRLFAGTENPS